MSARQQSFLGELVAEVRTGSTPPTSRVEFFDGYIPWYTPGDIGGQRDLRRAARRISPAAVSEGKAPLFHKDTILVTCIGNIGRVGILKQPASCNQQITALNLKSSIDARYAYYWLLAHQAVLKRNANSAVVPILNNERLLQIRVDYSPDLEEQIEIADRLEGAQCLVDTRRYALQLCDEFLPAAFLEMFGDFRKSIADQEVVELESIAEIVSGVTKGQRYNGKDTVTVPYLRVANVQDGYLDLSEIKTITVPVSDARSLLLRPGDVLMTEGGDYDKLGRGAIWHGEINACIHQNHIFRVRLDQSQALPVYFASLLRTRYAKGYFLKCAKQTTNLASINMTQLKATPVPLPPLADQKRLAAAVATHSALRATHLEALRQADHLFRSLLHRAFNGDL